MLHITSHHFMECVPVYALKMNTLLPGPTFWIFLIVSRLTKTIVRRIESQIMDLIEESLFTHSQSLKISAPISSMFYCTIVSDNHL